MYVLSLPYTATLSPNYFICKNLLGGSKSEDVDQHDLPPDPQPGPHNVRDDVSQGLHALSLLNWEKIVSS